MRFRTTAVFSAVMAGTITLWGSASASFAQTAPQTAPAPSTAPVVAATEDPLITQIDLAIQANSQRYLVANSNSPWQIFHGLLAYRKDFKVRVGNNKMSAIEWVATMEPQFDRQPLLLKTAHGAKFHPFTREYAFEGHQGQTLALLSESHLPIDYQFKIGNEQVTLGDFLNSLMMEFNSREEITWVLWALINYVKVDAQWVNQWGQAWNIESLVQMQVRARVEGGPCGGNHGLFVLVRARDKYLAGGRPLRGVWLEADQKIQRYIQIARSLQNPDGSFSSEFYEQRGFTRDTNERFNTTGHTFEFLSIALPEAQLNEPWVRSAAMVLANELYQQRRGQPSCGPMYHSLNALMNYRNRLRPPQPEVAATTTPAPTPAVPVTVPAPTTPVIAAPGNATIAKEPTIHPASPQTTEVILPADALKPANVPLPSATASPAPPERVLPVKPVVAPKAPVISGPMTLKTPPVLPNPTRLAPPPFIQNVSTPAPTPLKLPPSLEAKLLKINVPGPIAPPIMKSTTNTDPTTPRLPVVSPATLVPSDSATIREPVSALDPANR